MRYSIRVHLLRFLCYKVKLVKSIISFLLYIVIYVFIGLTGKFIYCNYKFPESMQLLIVTTKTFKKIFRITFNAIIVVRFIFTGCFIWLFKRTLEVIYASLTHEVILFVEENYPVQQKVFEMFEHY